MVELSVDLHLSALHPSPVSPHTPGRRPPALAYTRRILTGIPDRVLRMLIRPRSTKTASATLSDFCANVATTSLVARTNDLYSNHAMRRGQHRTTEMASRSCCSA